MRIRRIGGGLRVERLAGETLRARLGEIAQLRIEVFRDFPYLYAGDVGYERRYLETYLRSRNSALIAAFDDDRIIGASTALPLEDETANIVQPFRARGFDVHRIFYFGESVLLSRYRRRGVGLVFFEEREAWARSFNRYTMLSFCAVERPADHPLWPTGYVPLHAFWKSRGFEPVPEMDTEFLWRDLGDEEETPKKMRYWIKHLSP